MGFPVMVMGPSGSGKSASLRGFGPDEVGIINVAGKPLPFKNNMKTFDTSDYGKIYAALKRGNKRAFVIDDAQYLMGFEEMDSKKSGYDKFNSIGYNFVRLVRSVYQLPKDTIVYFLQHTEMGDDGVIKAKTLGKLIDTHYTLEGLFTVVLMTDVDKGKHHFITNSDGSNTTKSSMGMFDERVIDNDLKAVDEIIRDYYGLKPLVGDNDAAEAAGKEGEDA